MRFIAALALFAACGPPPPDEKTYALELGSASAQGTGYEPMPVPATLQPGSQGGFHVWLSYRVKGEARSVKAAHTVRREDNGKLLSRGERRLEVGAGGEDGWWRSEMATPAFLCPTPIGVAAKDADVVFEVKLLADDGEELATQQVKTKLACPAGDQADFCERICTG